MLCTKKRREMANYPYKRKQPNSPNSPCSKSFFPVFCASSADSSSFQGLFFLYILVQTEKKIQFSNAKRVIYKYHFPKLSPVNSIYQSQAIKKPSHFRVLLPALKLCPVVNLQIIFRPKLPIIMKDDFRLESKEEFYSKESSQESIQSTVNHLNMRSVISQYPQGIGPRTPEDPKSKMIDGNERWEERCQFLVILGALSNS